MNHSEKGARIAVDDGLNGASPEDFDAALLPGGVANADKLRMDENARKFVRYMTDRIVPSRSSVTARGSWFPPD